MRLFFALWPDAPAAEALERLAADVVVVAGGKPQPRAKIHLTLAFLGEVGEPMRAEEVAAALPTQPFRMRLDCVGSFRRARVAWAGALAPQAELVALQSRLEAGLRDAGFALEERPFTAHVTLARKIERALPRAAIAAIEWPAAQLTLVRSAAGTGDYSIVRSWRLGG